MRTWFYFSPGIAATAADYDEGKKLLKTVSQTKKDGESYFSVVKNNDQFRNLVYALIIFLRHQASSQAKAAPEQWQTDLSDLLQNDTVKADFSKALTITKSNQFARRQPEVAPATENRYDRSHLENLAAAPDKPGQRGRKILGKRLTAEQKDLIKNLTQQARDRGLLNRPLLRAALEKAGVDGVSAPSSGAYKSVIDAMQVYDPNGDWNLVSANRKS